MSQASRRSNLTLLIDNEFAREVFGEEEELPKMKKNNYWKRKTSLKNMKSHQRR